MAAAIMAVIIRSTCIFHGEVLANKFTIIVLVSGTKITSIFYAIKINSFIDKTLFSNFPNFIKKKEEKTKECS